MNIRKDFLKAVNEKWSGFKRSSQDITRIVLHATGGGGTLSFMKKGGQGKQEQKIRVI